MTTCEAASGWKSPCNRPPCSSSHLSRRRPAPHAGKYFKITVVDEQTGRGVPLVELRTVNGVRY